MKLFALSYATAIYALFFNVQPVLVGVLQKSFGFDEEQLGQILAVAFLVSAVTVGSSYFWINRYSPRRSIAVGISVAIGGLALLFLATTYVTVMAGMTLLSFGLAITAAPVVTTLGSMPDPTKAFAYGISAMVLLAAVCVYLIPVVLFPNWGYMGVISFLTVLVGGTLLLVPWIPEAPALNNRHDSAQISSNGNPWLALFATVLYFAGINSNWAFFELLGERLELPSSEIGISICAALLIGALGSLAAVVIGQRLSAAKVMVITLIGFFMYAGILLTTARPAESPWSFAVAAALFNIVWNFSLPYAMELVRAHDQHGRLVGQIPTAQMLGGALGPLAAGFLLTDFGAGWLFALLIACVLCAGFLFAGLERR